jgi:hypothetical protein
MAQTSYDNGLGSVVECTQAQLSKMLKPPTALVRSVAEQLQEARFVTTMAVTDGGPATHDRELCGEAQMRLHRHGVARAPRGRPPSHE